MGRIKSTNLLKIKTEQNLTAISDHQLNISEAMHILKSKFKRIWRYLYIGKAQDKGLRHVHRVDFFLKKEYHRRNQAADTKEQEIIVYTNLFLYS